MAGPFSIWQKDEMVKAAVLPQVGLAMELRIFPGLFERRIYLYLEVNQASAAAYILEAVLVAKRGQAEVARIPCSIADFTGLTPGGSVASALNVGGSPVGDSIVLRLGSPFTTSTTTAVMQPYRANWEADMLQLHFLSVAGATLTGWRAFLGCESTKYPS